MKIKNMYIPPGYIVIAAIILLISTGTLLFSSLDSSEKQTTLLSLNVLSKDFTVTQGERAQIEVNFSDNIVEATLNYRKEGDTTWNSVSILSKTYSISIAENETKNYHYYVTVNDKGDSGPIGEPATNGSTFYIITVFRRRDPDENITIQRAVFIEEATATTCSNCPDVAEKIHQVYNTGKIPFYYVSLVGDKNQKANNRLQNEYNLAAYPTVYIDGGYKVLYGAQSSRNDFDSALEQAANRPAARIKITLQSEWNETREELKNTVFVKNYEKTTYTGTLKLYITEIRSQWSDYNGDPYHFSFIDYGLERTIQISPGENESFSNVWKESESGYSIVKENLWIVAVVFDNQKHISYSNPTDRSNEFNTYYVDATAASRVTEGALPPTIGLKTPKQLNHYIFGNERKNTFLPITYLIGRMTIETTVESDLAVEKVTIEITGRRTDISINITEDPYKYTWDRFSFGKHTITATVYDQQGRKNSDSIEVWALIF
ncbi:MAG: hypothetical protein QCI00_00905 [Candidatus Thermoplasmatota archaeon]|nr:hypothetical protein [Candidatus Thermoplasmatota archaeon]